MDLEKHIILFVISRSSKPVMNLQQSASSKSEAIILIFETALDAFKLYRFQPNFNHSFLIIAYVDHSQCHQGHQPQSEMSIILINSSNDFSNVINLGEES